MVRSYSLTEGFFKLGSNAPMLGATLKGWADGVKNADGVSAGAGTLVGNPCAIRFAVPLGATQPAVVLSVPAVFRELTQFSINPGIFPAMAVIWNVEMVSNNNP